MLTLGENGGYPYSAIADFCDYMGLQGHRIHLDDWFHAAFGYKSEAVRSYPYAITNAYGYWNELLGHLFRLKAQECYPHRIKTYQEKAIIRMVEGIRKFWQPDDYPSHYCHTPGYLTYRELHQPYVVLREILNWKCQADWNRMLYRWQINALCGAERIYDMEEDDLEGYRCLHKLLDICFLIYTVELDTKEVTGPVLLDG